MPIDHAEAVKRARKMVSHLQGRGCGNEPMWQPQVEYFASAIERAVRETAEEIASQFDPGRAADAKHGEWSSADVAEWIRTVYGIEAPHA
jgi:hypothetical protein